MLLNQPLISYLLFKYCTYHKIYYTCYLLYFSNSKPKTFLQRITKDENIMTFARQASILICMIAFTFGPLKQIEKTVSNAIKVNSPPFSTMLPLGLFLSQTLWSLIVPGSFFFRNPDLRRATVRKIKGIWAFCT